jgi:hypothetical protein
MPYCAVVIQSNSCGTARRHRHLSLRNATEINATFDLHQATPKNASIVTPMSFLRTESKESDDSRRAIAILRFGCEDPESSVPFPGFDE